MVNLASEDIARGEPNPQPFFPYVTADYHQHPWLPRLNAHTNALTAWKTKNSGARKKAIAFQMWLRRHIRFVFAAEMCNDWTPFGGLVAQLNSIAVILSLASLESAGYAMRYRELLVTTLKDFARARFPCDYQSALSEVHEDTRRAAVRGNQAVAARFTPNANSSVESFPRNQKGKSRPKGKRPKGKGNAPKGSGEKGGKRSGVNNLPIGKGAANANAQPVNPSTPGNNP